MRENDILFVNDGTFLIGRTAMVTKFDIKSIIQSHVRKIRVLNREEMSPYYLFYLLNSKIVRKQIDSKIFVQATISTIGNRLNEIMLPIAVDERERIASAAKIKDIIDQKIELRRKTMEIMQNE
jgi:type I restriction enzyme M protein